MQVVYEDNHVLAVIKPSGILSQADKSKDIDMLSQIKQYLKEKYNKPGDVYVGLVHRLDRSVSGLMIFAKTSKAAARLSKSIREGDFKKEYVALVYGEIPVGKIEVLSDLLYKDERNNMSYVVNENTKESVRKRAKEAKLEYQCINQGKIGKEDISKIRVKLFTGRHHQIRVQMANAGFPLVGDVKYGGKKGKTIALYACHISVPHPTKDEIISLDSEPIEEIWGKI